MRGNRKRTRIAWFPSADGTSILLPSRSTTWSLPITCIHFPAGRPPSQPLPTPATRAEMNRTVLFGMRSRLHREGGTPDVAMEAWYRVTPAACTRWRHHALYCTL